MSARAWFFAQLEKELAECRKAGLSPPPSAASMLPSTPGAQKHKPEVLSIEEEKAAAKKADTKKAPEKENKKSSSCAIL